ncbi:hypothetical protein [Vibrio harveyi]
MNPLQIHLAFWSAMLFLGSFELKEFFGAQGMTDIDSLLGGYIVGYITIFAGFSLWEILAGRGRRFLDNRPYWRVISAIPLILLILIGAAGFYKEIFGSTPWQYNIGFFIASFAVGRGLIPVINHIDSRLQES